MRSFEGALLLVVAPLGNLSDFVVGERALERIVTQSDDLAKRVLRFATSRGDIGLRLATDRLARDGDVIFADDALVIALEVAPDEVIVCRPASIGHALVVGHALGNRHLPIQVEGDTLVLRYDRLVEELFVAADVAYTHEYRKLAAPFRHAHAPHGHA